jgi:hypothetical protein
VNFYSYVGRCSIRVNYSEAEQEEASGDTAHREAVKEPSAREYWALAEPLALAIQGVNREGTVMLSSSRIQGLDGAIAQYTNGLMKQ